MGFKKLNLWRINMKNEITKEMLKELCQNYEEAIETLHNLANKSTGTAKEEISESLEDFFTQ
tara:strand:- start:2260 stop:2445 length:186 start_codon:yes stop_codon:yes gene_type:complete